MAHPNLVMIHPYRDGNGRMVDAGLLEPKGEKRGRYYVATPRLLSLAEASWEQERSAEQVDPFAEVQLSLFPGR